MNMQRALFALVACRHRCVAIAQPASAQTEQVPPPRLKWSFAGPFGKYDEAQLQRGFKIYREVCANCHSLEMVSFRNLADAGGPGFSEAQVEAIAAEYKIKDLDDQGDPIERAGRLADHFPPPFANELAAEGDQRRCRRPTCRCWPRRAATSAASPGSSSTSSRSTRSRGRTTSRPLSAATRTRRRTSSCRQSGHYNEYFPGHDIAMPPPLQDGQVTYDDGSPETVEQYAKDVAAFLMWAAEPQLDARKRIGFQVMIFLIVLAGLMYFTKKKVWSAVH